MAQFEAAAGGVAEARFLTAAQVQTLLDKYQLPNGDSFTDKEKNFFMKSSGADMGEFTLGQFADFLARVRMYKRPEKKWTFFVIYKSSIHPRKLQLDSFCIYISQGKPWWRSVAILTCKSIVGLEYRSERLIVHS